MSTDIGGGGARASERASERLPRVDPFSDWCLTPVRSVEGNVRAVMYFGVGLERDAGVLAETGVIPDGHERTPAVMVGEWMGRVGGKHSSERVSRGRSFRSDTIRSSWAFTKGLVSEPASLIPTTCSGHRRQR